MAEGGGGESAQLLGAKLPADYGASTLCAAGMLLRHNQDDVPTRASRALAEGHPTCCKWG